MFRRKRSQNDFSDEVRAHIEAEAQRLRDEGMNEVEAKSAAQFALRENVNLPTMDGRTRTALARQFQAALQS